MAIGEPRSFTVAPLMLITGASSTETELNTALTSPFTLLDPVVTVLISTSVQFFIAWRIKIISNSLAMPIVIVVLGTCSLIGGVTLTGLVIREREWAAFTKFEPAVITWLGASAVADVLITASLSWSLASPVSSSAATDDKVTKIIRLTVQTGLVTAIFATLDVVIFVTVKGTTLNFLWDFPLSKLYTNALLSTLNARAGWNKLTGTGQSTDENNVLMFRRSELRQYPTTHRQTVTGVFELEATVSQAQEHRVRLGKLDNRIEVTTAAERLADRPEEEDRSEDQKYKKSAENEV
ncbi:unnamed protein product [Cyclocybe aegerita]|uniref:DUF6534 domain-containing protein n=1 Tax=Cyclocybe aegerita TaxID=1973307 RepID=A0A8S0VS75_CYCAE|nr:unnamed protein product [Cyclocybe aegerita]